MTGRSFLTTREAAEVLGVGTTSVKRWADSGVLRCVKTAGGHRRFPRAAVEALLRGGVPAPTPERDRVADWLALLIDRLAPPGAPRGTTAAVTGRLRRAYEDTGSWFEVAELLGEVLEEIGRRWNNGDIDVLEEHLASERLRRGLAAIAAAVPVADDARRALLIAADGEEHTLGLSLVELCLTAAGWRCQWGGRSTPFSDVRKLVAAGGVDLIAVSASANSTNQAALAEQADRYGELAREHGVTLLLGGRGPWPDPPAYGDRLSTFGQLQRVLGEL